MKVLITGANGFVGRNLVAHLSERKDIEIVTFNRSDDVARLSEIVAEVGFVFHLAGVNRPQVESEFKLGNTDLTQALCDAISAFGKPVPVLYTSSIQAQLDNPYGLSKRHAEQALIELKSELGANVYLFRLPNVFGKWARPNYNSAVATFCHNIVNDLPIKINDPDALISLVYIDDVIAKFIAAMDQQLSDDSFIDVEPCYTISVGSLADQLRAFSRSRVDLLTQPVGHGLVRALYSTYVSYFSTEQFTYEVPKHEDPRGVFVEMLKTPDSGQFSYFTAHPGVTRGGHYHHSKTEKFLVIKGTACFRFRHIVSLEYYELITDGKKPVIVETVPGWTHDITNIGDDELIVMLWANEVFDRAHPDTYTRAVG